MLREETGYCFLYSRKKIKQEKKCESSKIKHESSVLNNPPSSPQYFEKKKKKKCGTKIEKNTCFILLRKFKSYLKYQIIDSRKVKLQRKSILQRKETPKRYGNLKNNSAHALIFTSYICLFSIYKEVYDTNSKNLLFYYSDALFVF